MCRNVSSRACVCISSTLFLGLFLPFLSLKNSRGELIIKYPTVSVISSSFPRKLENPLVKILRMCAFNYASVREQKFPLITFGLEPELYFSLSPSFSESAPGELVSIVPRQLLLNRDRTFPRVFLNEGSLLGFFRRLLDSADKKFTKALRVCFFIDFAIKGAFNATLARKQCIYSSAVLCHAR